MNINANFNAHYGSVASKVSDQSSFVRWLPVVLRRLSNIRSLHILMAATLGAAAAIALLTMVTALPASQHLSGLAALAAGIGMPMAMHSLRDESLARGLLRATMALAAGFIAYQALSYGWGILAISLSVLFAWATTDWVHNGVSIRLAGLLSGLLVLAGFAMTQI